MNFDQNDKVIEQRVGTLEQMFGQLLAEQMAANANGGGAAGMNVPVMPILGGSEEAKLPWTFDTETGKWLRPFINLPTGRYAVDSADGVEGRNYVKIAFSGSDPVVETHTIVSSDETNIDEDIYCFYVGTLAEDPNDQEKLIQTEGVYSEPVLMVYV